MQFNSLTSALALGMLLSTATAQIRNPNIMPTISSAPSPVSSSSLYSTGDADLGTSAAPNSVVSLGNEKVDQLLGRPTNTVTYSGPAISGMAELPQYLEKVIFPKYSKFLSFPGLGSIAHSLGINALPQAKTNGNSILGTPDAQRLGPSADGTPGLNPQGVLAHGPPPAHQGPGTPGMPWGNRTAGGTNPYTGAPYTGKVRSYQFTVSRGNLAPDGVERSMILINNQFPGPTIEADWGDIIQVTVFNNITGPTEGTSIHWHGLLQAMTNYEDGVPGITQCPIPPGYTYTYEFQADLYGTSWYHSHFSAQYAGGALGPMIIHGPKHVDYDEDLGPVLLTDYYHYDYYSIVENVMSVNLNFLALESTNNLINGKGNYNCSLVPAGTQCTPNAGLSKFKFTAGKTYRLRLINGAAEAIQRFSIDGHQLEVIAYDFVPIIPYTTKVVTLGVGQRADVLVRATGGPRSSFWMRSTISTTCSITQQPNALAIIYYDHADTNSQPTSTAWPIDDSTCQNDPLTETVPFFPLPPPKAQTTVDVSLSFEINATGHFLWTLDGSTFRTDYNSPILHLVESNNATSSIEAYPREWNLYDMGSNSSYIFVINNQNPIAHPFHLHGHNMWVLSFGTGTWDGTIQGNPYNPTRRDTQLLPPSGYIAVQVQADNPGVWPFHCHIAWHVSGGLYLNILERPDEIQTMVKLPRSANNLCSAWDNWTKTGFVDMIDSGLKRRDNLGRDEKARLAGLRRQHLSKRKFDHNRHNL